jgi:lysophospholipase L1-like esterase
MSMYVRRIAYLGSSGNQGVWHIGDSLNQTPKLQLYTSGTDHSAENNTGSGYSAASVSPTLESGDLIEALVQVAADGSVTIVTSVNSGEAISNTGSPIEFADVFSDQKLFINALGSVDVGFAAFRDIISARGVRDLDWFRERIDHPWPIAMWGDSMTVGNSHGEGTNILDQLATAYEADNRTTYMGGVSGQDSTEIRARFEAETEMQNWIRIIWAGQNDTTEELGTVFQDNIAAMVAGAHRFLVLGVINTALDAIGTEKYEAVLQANAVLAERYPNNFIDIRDYLLSRHDPEDPSQVSSVANGVVPLPMRADIIHLSLYGETLVANRVKQFIDAKGW